MDRRGFVSGGAALSLLAGGARPGAAFAAAPAITPDDLRGAAREGWIYGLPLIEAARLRRAAIGDKPEVGTPGFNSFLHQRAPAGAEMRDFSAPEPDVLYSSAWIHLAGGPAKISVPPTGGRYFSLALIDLYGNVLDTIDGHEASQAGHEVTVIGPPPRVGMYGYSAPVPRMPSLHKMLHTPDLWVWALARTHVEGEHDLPAARALQDGLAVQVKPARARPAPPVARDAAWSDYFFAVQELINENPPPPADMGFFRRVAPLQLGTQSDFEKARFADPDLPQIAKGAAEGVVLASQAPDVDHTGGWAYPKPNIGDYGQDFLYRAQVALTEHGSLEPHEVTCLRAVGPGGARSFPGDGRHRVVLPSAPPADGFWSLSLYEAQPDGRLFLADNPIGRHFIGGWTPGLRKRPDGSIEIAISRTNPDRDENWLPAPASAPFALILRAYAPAQPILDRRWRPGPVETL